MKFSLNLINQNLKPALTFKLAEKLLNNHLFETELIGKTSYDYILNVDILPNRAFDLFSHYGLARELACLFKIKTGKPIKFIEYKPKKLALTPKPTIRFIDQSDNNLLRYSMLYIKNIKVTDSPAKIKNLLLSLGIKPINLLVDLTNLIMVETGQPLHAFDADTLKNKTIIVGFPLKPEKLETFDGKVYNLDPSILTIRDAAKPLAIAGVKGGLETGIKASTKNVIIESANFSPLAIRHTAACLKIGSDAEKRFKNGLNPQLTSLALARFLELYFKYAPKINFEYYDYQNTSLINQKKPKPINISLSSINSLLNTSFKNQKIKQILKLLGFKIIKTNKKNLTVLQPSFRNDLQNEEDIIDEIFRLMDLKNIKRAPYFSEIKKPMDLAGFKIISQMRNLLLDNGFSEIVSYSMVSKKCLLDFYNENQFADFLKLKNPISLEFEYLRPNIVISLLQAVSKNIRFYDEFKLFEIGKIYYNNKNSIPVEENCLGITIYHKSEDKLKQMSTIRTLKGLINAMVKSWGKPQFIFDQNKELRIFLDSILCGRITYLPQNINQKYKILGKTLMAELFLDKIIRLKPKEKRFHAFNKYPSVKRDISLIADSLRYDEIIQILDNLELEYLQNIELFDIYTDMAKGFTSYTIHLYFGAKNRSITQQEADNEFQNIINILKTKGIKIR